MSEWWIQYLENGDKSLLFHYKCMIRYAINQIMKNYKIYNQHKYVYLLLL